mgnify:CR=1 FL=1
MYLIYFILRTPEYGPCSRRKERGEGEDVKGCGQLREDDKSRIEAELRVTTSPSQARTKVLSGFSPCFPGSRVYIVSCGCSLAQDNEAISRFRDEGKGPTGTSHQLDDTTSLFPLLPPQNYS